MNGHGGQVWAADGSRSIRLDFSASLWPERLKLPRITRGDLEPYPDPNCTALEAAAAKHFGVRRDAVIAVNGATEGIYLAMRLLQPRRLTIYEPAFNEYARAAAWATSGQARIHHLITPHLAPVAGDTVVLANPGNPTGTLCSPTAVATWLDAMEAAGVRVLVDEAFVDFVAMPARHTLVRKLDRWPNLLVLRSLTKRFGLAGVRLGFVLGSATAISRLRELRLPWSVGTTAQQIGQTLLRQPVSADLATRVARERKYLTTGLRRLGFTVFPSTVNFVLARMPGANPNRALLAALRARGIALRDAANFFGLDQSYLRCAVRPRPELRQLLAAIKEVQ